MDEVQPSIQRKISDLVALIESGRGSLHVGLKVSSGYDTSYWVQRLGVSSEFRDRFSDFLYSKCIVVNGSLYTPIYDVPYDFLIIGEWRIDRLLGFLYRLEICRYRGRGDKEFYGILFSGIIKDKSVLRVILEELEL